MIEGTLPALPETWEQRRDRCRLQKNFKVDDKVRIHDTCDDTLDGQTVTVLGKYAEDSQACFYIILLATPRLDGTKAIVLIESCLDYPTVLGSVN